MKNEKKWRLENMEVISDDSENKDHCSEKSDADNEDGDKVELDDDK